jgi:hypothetical protein
MLAQLLRRLILVKIGIGVFIFRQPWTTQPPTLLAATDSSQKAPVVLVQGYLCNHRIWDDMVAAMLAKGHDVFSINLEPLFCSIDAYAPRIQYAITENREAIGPCP